MRTRQLASASPRKTISVRTYAAYGSNLHPVRLINRTPTARLLGTARLPDWSMQFCKRSKDASGKCTLVPGSDGVHAAIFELSAADKQVLDDIEGVGKGYSEISLHVPGYGDCFSYALAKDSGEALLFTGEDFARTDLTACL